MMIKTKKATKPKTKPMPKIKVLFVCTGNTCRSPMLEFCFKAFLKQKKLLSKYDVKSAGVFANEGDIISDNAVKALKSFKIACSLKKAKLVCPHLTKKSDYIICMTKQHKIHLEDDENLLKSKLLTMAEITKGPDVPDPYGLGLEEYSTVLEYFIYACEDIFRAVHNFE